MQRRVFIPNKTEQIVYNLWNNYEIIDTNNFHIENILLNVFEQSVYTDYFILLPSVHILNIISIFMRFVTRHVFQKLARTFEKGRFPFFRNLTMM